MADIISTKAEIPEPTHASNKAGSSENPRECLSCRITGTAVLAGTGSYAIWQSRAAAPGSPGQKKIAAGLGLALVVAGVFRWRSWKCKPLLIESMF